MTGASQATLVDSAMMMRLGTLMMTAAAAATAVAMTTGSKMTGSKMMALTKKKVATATVGQPVRQVVVAREAAAVARRSRRSQRRLVVPQAHAQQLVLRTGLHNGPARQQQAVHSRARTLHPT